MAVARQINVEALGARLPLTVRVQREQQPCPFVAIRHGAGSDALCKEGQKEGFGKCAQCKGWAATARDKRVPFHADDVAKVKAACVARLQGQFSGMQVA